MYYYLHLPTEVPLESRERTEANKACSCESRRRQEYLSTPSDSGLFIVYTHILASHLHITLVLMGVVLQLNFGYYFINFIYNSVDLQYVLYMHTYT